VKVELTLILSWPAEGGEWSASSPDRYSPRKSKPPVPTEHEALWTAEPVWAFWRTHILTTLPGMEPRLFGCPGRSLVTLPTQLFRLPLRTTNFFFYVRVTVHRNIFLCNKTN
jgi:hypothetical protein